MAEELKIEGSCREERYAALLPQIRSLLDAEPDPVANMANIAACLKETFGFWWVGFYRVLPSGPDGNVSSELVLGPFQGPLACTRIRKGRGVCGTAWQKARTIIVPDVDLFPGHIACSSASRSEIVVPVFRSGQVAAVLDIDSDRLRDFDEVDRRWLEELVRYLSL